jgi:hypothetical protein
MGRFYHRRRFDYYRYNESQRAEAKQGLAGIDDDVLKIFNSLDGLKRKILFNHYESAHGKSAANYARNKMGDWASGAVRASGQTLTRLLNLVPKVLNQNQKYDLLKKLYDAHRSGHQENHSLTVVVGHSTGFREQVTDLALRLCNKPDTHTLPSYVQEKIAWVCDNDSTVARSIMAAIEKEFSFAIAAAGRTEVENLVNRIQGLDVSAEGTHTIRLPYGVITVYVRKPNLFEKIGKFFS